MNKIFRTDCFVFSSKPLGYEMQKTMGFVPCRVSIEVTDEEIEYRTRLNEEIKIRCKLSLLKELIEEYALAGSTVLREDKENQSVIRYTKGIPHTNAKHVTISLAQTDDKGNEQLQLTADATELDKYLRRKWEK